MTDLEKREVDAAMPWTCDECDAPVAPGERFCSDECAERYGKWIDDWVAPFESFGRRETRTDRQLPNPLKGLLTFAKEITK